MAEALTLGDVVPEAVVVLAGLVLFVALAWYVPHLTWKPATLMLSMLALALATTIIPRSVPNGR